jgi:hypothetical protein
MATLKRRLFASVLLTLLSLVSIMLLLPRSRVDQLQKITLGTTIDLGMGDMVLWGWGSGEVEDDRVEESGEGVRLVVFGDSWVDDSVNVEKEGNGKGKSWPKVLCEEVCSFYTSSFIGGCGIVLCVAWVCLLTSQQINCTSRLNFAASQPADAFPSFEPTGVAVSNAIHAAAIKKDQSIPLDASSSSPLPDLATQIQSFISLPVPKQQPKETLFVLSFGFWDVYDFARMDFAVAQNATDRSINAIFEQLDVLYLHFVEKLYPPGTSETPAPVTNATEAEDPLHPTFRVILPRLFDPTLLPGWLSQRPLPLSPSSIAEQQKNAVYLTERWNSLMENKMGAWINSPPPVSASSAVVKSAEMKEASRTDVRHSEPSSKAEDEFDQGISEAEPVKEHIQPSALSEKDMFYYDMPNYLLSIIVEHNLEREGLSDSNGLGKGSSPYDSVYSPCVRDSEVHDEEKRRSLGRRGDEGSDGGDVEEEDEYEERNGMLVCREPEDFLFWDAWGLGPSAKKEIGRAIGEMVLEGKSLRKAWEGVKTPGRI